jgi:hypothetical protein
MRSVGAFEAKTHLAARLVPRVSEVQASVAETIAGLRRFSQGQTLGGLSIAELSDLGRR